MFHKLIMRYRYDRYRGYIPRDPYFGVRTAYWYPHNSRMRDPYARIRFGNVQYGPVDHDVHTETLAEEIDGQMDLSPPSHFSEVRDIVPGSSTSSFVNAATDNEDSISRSVHNQLALLNHDYYGAGSKRRRDD